MYDSWKNLYPLVNVTFTGRFSLAIVSIKVFVNNGMSTKLWCQNSQEIEAVLEDLVMMFFFYTRGLAFRQKIMTLHPTGWTVIKGNKDELCKKIVMGERWQSSPSQRAVWAIGEK